MSQELGIGEQAISKAAEAAIKTQMDEAETLNVEIHTDPIKLAQGQVDNVVVEGTGLLVKDDLRTEEIKLEASSVDIDMMKAALGHIELEQPAEAEARIVLNAEDIQKAFNSGYVKQKLRGQKIELSSGETVTTDASNVQFQIPEAGKISVEADVMLMEKVETHHVAFSARPKLVENGHALALEDIQYDDATNDKPELTRSLIESTKDLLDLRNFEIGDMALQFDQLDVQPGKLIIKAQATVESLG